MKMVDDIFEKTQEFSVFIGISLMAHLVGLFVILLILPSPTKAKLQKSTVRVGVKYAQKPTLAPPAGVKKQPAPQKQPAAVATPKKGSAAAKKKAPPKPKVTQPLKKPTLSTKDVVTKPIYVPKKIKPQPSNLKLNPTLKKPTQKTLQPPVKAPQLSIARPKPDLPKAALKKPQSQPLQSKLPAKVASIPLPQKLPKTQLPKITPLVPKAPTLTNKPSNKAKAPQKKEKSAPSTAATGMRLKPAESPELAAPLASAKEAESTEPPLATTGQAQENVVPQPNPDLKVPVPSSLSAQKNSPAGSSFLLKQQQEKYNALIAVVIKQNLYAPERYQSLSARIEVVIGAAGELLQYTLQRSSGVEAFDLTALKAVKTTQFPPLPEELAKNPPYVVPLLISP